MSTAICKGSLVLSGKRYENLDLEVFENPSKYNMTIYENDGKINVRFESKVKSKIDKDNVYDKLINLFRSLRSEGWNISGCFKYFQRFHKIDELSIDDDCISEIIGKNPITKEESISFEYTLDEESKPNFYNLAKTLSRIKPKMKW